MTLQIENQAKNLKYILSLPPYQFITKHIDNILNKYSMTMYSEDDVYQLKRLYNIISKDLNRDINEMLRLVEIEDDLIRLIEATDNRIFYRKLFFPSIFINNEFKFDNWIIKGILVEECITDFAGNAIRPSDENLEKNDYIIFVTIINPSTNEFWNLTFFLVDKTLHKRDKDYDPKGIQKYIRNIICNMVDAVDGNDEDLDIVTIETSKEHNDKRIRKGKVPFPTKIYIRAKGEFKKYVQKFNIACEDNEKRKLGHKFLVRGHWMKFRAERYIRKKGERTWVKPFWKGEGVVISKDYKLVQSEKNEYMLP